jgi:phospholipid/cholesterol/gamma-HCH transport system substrate-binding protein
MSRARHRRIPLLACALLVSVLAGGVGAEAQRSGVEITAEFTDAGAIIRGNDVMIDGVRAGSIRRLSVGDGKARVTFSVDAAFTPLHTDARAAIRLISLLGERYLDLDPGTPSAPVLADGGVIPASRTQRAVELQELLDVVDQPTGTALAALIVAFGEGMAARGQDAAAAIDAIEPAFTETSRLLDILGGQNQLLAALIDRTEPVVAAMAAERGARMDRLVAASDQLLGATAAERPALEEALRRLPTALTTVRSALAELSDLAGRSTPVLASLRPMTGNLRQMADELSAFADASGAALASTDPVLEKARDLVAAATPVTAELRAAGGDMQTAARGFRTIVEALPEDLSNLLDFVRNAALATAGHDGISHYLRIFVLANCGAVTGLPCESSPSAALAAPGELPAIAPAAAPPAAPAPVTPEPVGGLLGTGVIDRLLAPPATRLLGTPPAPGLSGPRAPGPGGDAGSATGLTNDQERSLLRYLLGAG